MRLSQTHVRAPVRYRNAAPHVRGAGHAHLDVLLEGGLRLHFDTHDAREIAVGELDDCDFYFKRSYRRETVAALPEAVRARVLPLGLNYRVLPDTADLPALRRALVMSGLSRPGLAGARQALDTGNRFGFQPRLRQMEAEPELDAPPSVLFLVAAYDPHDDPGRTPEKIEDRISINAMRARCIRLLREALGSRFSGGFGSSAFTLRHFPDLIWPGSASQESYLRTLRAFPICIATTGLHGSTGWKLAEYVAFSKAILSEPLQYEVPGEFRSGTNYLEFGSPEECVQAAIRLSEDPQLRRQMMRNNADYYRRYLRPDVLVENALLRALRARGAFRADTPGASDRSDSIETTHRSARTGHASK